MEAKRLSMFKLDEVTFGRADSGGNAAGIGMTSAVTAAMAAVRTARQKRRSVMPDVFAGVRSERGLALMATHNDISPQKLAATRRADRGRALDLAISSKRSMADSSNLLARTGAKSGQGSPDLEMAQNGWAVTSPANLEASKQADSARVQTKRLLKEMKLSSTWFREGELAANAGEWDEDKENAAEQTDCEKDAWLAAVIENPSHPREQSRYEGVDEDSDDELDRILQAQGRKLSSAGLGKAGHASAAVAIPRKRRASILLANQLAGRLGRSSVVWFQDALKLSPSRTTRQAQSQFPTRPEPASRVPFAGGATTKSKRMTKPAAPHRTVISSGRITRSGQSRSDAVARSGQSHSDAVARSGRSHSDAVARSGQSHSDAVLVMRRFGGAVSSNAGSLRRRHVDSQDSVHGLTLVSAGSRMHEPSHRQSQQSGRHRVESGSMTISPGRLLSRHSPGSEAPQDQAVPRAALRSGLDGKMIQTGIMPETFPNHSVSGLSHCDSPNHKESHVAKARAPSPQPPSLRRQHGQSTPYKQVLSRDRKVNRSSQRPRALKQSPLAMGRSRPAPRALLRQSAVGRRRRNRQPGSSGPPLSRPLPARDVDALVPATADEFDMLAKTGLLTLMRDDLF